MRLLSLLFLFVILSGGLKSQTCSQISDSIENALKLNIDPIKEINYFSTHCSKKSEENKGKLHVYLLKQFRVRGRFDDGVRYAKNHLPNKLITAQDCELALELSILYFILNEYDKAIPLCYSILKTKAISLEVKAKAYSMLANAHWKLGNSQYAEKYFQSSFHHANTLNDSSLISVALNGLGLINYSKGGRIDLLRATNYFQRSIEFISQTNSFDRLSTTNNLAAVYYQLKDYNKAAKLFSQCLQLSKEIGDTSTTITVLNNLGSIALIRKDLAAADNYLNESLSLHRLFRGDEPSPSELLLSLSDLNYAKGNYQLSRDYYEQYASASLNLLNTERNQAMIEMQEKYEALNKKKEINDLKISKQRSELSNLRLQNLIAFLTIFFIVFLSILFFIIYLKRKKDRSQKLIELKRAELEASENEKLRISRELHDSLGGTFTVLSLLLNQQQDQDPENEVLQKMREVIDLGTTDLRQLCRDIYPQGLKIGGLAPSLHDLFATFNDRQNVVKFDLDFDSLDFVPGFSINFYRIAQELANNTLKYSNGDRASLTGKKQDGVYRIEYKDNGIGIDDKNIKIGVGLNSILERSRSYFGKVSFEKQKNADPGFCITIEFHLDHILT